MSQFDPDPDAQGRGTADELIVAATERLVETVERLGPDAVNAALLREIRRHGLAERATIWRRVGSIEGGPRDIERWVSQRSFGPPTPDPSAAASEGWRVAGLGIFELGPSAAVVVTGPRNVSSGTMERLREVLGALATLVGLLQDEEGGFGLLGTGFEDVLPPALPGQLGDDEPEQESDEAA